MELLDRKGIFDSQFILRSCHGSTVRTVLKLYLNINQLANQQNDDN